MKEKNVLVTSTLNVEVNKLWKVISTINETIWFPTMVKSMKVEGEGEGSHRFCTFIDGTSAKEKITKIDHDNKVLEYQIQDKPDNPVKNMINQMKLTDLGSNKTEVKWSSSFESSEEMEDQMVEMLNGAFQIGLKELEAHCS